MPTTEDYDFVGSFNNERFPSMDAERTLNCFEYLDPLSKKPKSLLGTSGLVNSGLAFNASGTFRASFDFAADSYHVVGADLFKVSVVGGNLQSIRVNGSVPIVPSSGYVGIDANTFQIIIVTGTNGYIYDTISGNFVQITDPSFPKLPLDCCALDNFFTVINGGTNNFYLSSLNQGLIWGADNTGSQTALQLHNGNPSITITSFGVGATIANYQIGTPVVITGLGGGTGFTNGNTYYVVAIDDSTHFRLSATNGGVFITPTADSTATITNNGQLQVGSITTHPGTLVACRTLHRRLFLFSQFFTEVWENLGIGTTLPFRRNNSLLMEYGCAALGSVAVGFDRMFFLSQDRDGLGAVMMVVGSESIPVSTKSVDLQFAAYNSTVGISDARSFLIKDNGIIFYRINFTAANNTFVFNVTMSNPQSDEMKKWHEEQTLLGNRHVAQTHVYFNGTNYVGSYLAPILYEMDRDIFTNDGENIKRMRIARSQFPPGAQRRRIDRIQMDFVQGQNFNVTMLSNLILLENGIDNLITENSFDLITEQLNPISTIVQPKAYLSISKDGGQTYGNLLVAPLGNPGQRTFRTLWRKLGVTKRGQSFVSKLEFYDAVPFCVLGASWTYEILPE